jgi:hypothetical protein
MDTLQHVRLLIGANAYAVIKHGSNCQTDILLGPGKSAQTSLRAYASELRAEIARKADLAALACAAADYLDKEKDSRK